MPTPELEYCRMRAREEAYRALRSNQPEAADAHHRLSIRYSARAFMLRDKRTPAEKYLRLID